MLRVEETRTRTKAALTISTWINAGKISTSSHTWIANQPRCLQDQKFGLTATPACLAWKFMDCQTSRVWKGDLATRSFPEVLAAISESFTTLLEIPLGNSHQRHGRKQRWSRYLGRASQIWDVEFRNPPKRLEVDMVKSNKDVGLFSLCYSLWTRQFASFGSDQVTNVKADHANVRAIFQQWDPTGLSAAKLLVQLGCDELGSLGRSYRWSPFAQDMPRSRRKSCCLFFRTLESLIESCLVCRVYPFRHSKQPLFHKAEMYPVVTPLQRVFHSSAKAGSNA